MKNHGMSNAKDFNACISIVKNTIAPQNLSHINSSVSKRAHQTNGQKLKTPSPIFCCL